MNATLDTLLTRTRAAAERRASATAADYAAMVDDVARGEKQISADDLATWLDEHGFEVSAFTASVTHRAARLSAAAALAARPAAEKKLGAAETKLAGLKVSLEAKIATERAKFEAAVKKLTDEHATAAAPHETAQAEAERAIEAAGEAEAHLIDTASDELKAEVARARENVRNAVAWANKHAEELQRAERKVKERRADVIKEAEYKGECTFRDESGKPTGESGHGHFVVVKQRVEANKKRFVEEALAREDAPLQAIRDKIVNQQRSAAYWERQIPLIEQRMLVV